jgi:sialate O-acetylesterase
MIIRSLLATLCATLCFASVSRAEVTPNALFSDHMVLQNGVAVPVWGMAAAGERVTVKLEGQTRTAVADAGGKWMVKLARLKSGGPFTMTIAGSGAAAITIHDVLVGEVWLGSGQSNMVFNVSNTGHRPYGLLDEKQEIAAANYPQVRMFTVADTKSLTPQTDVKGEWKVCSPETVADFSAIGYLFARDLNQALKQPVGIILSAYGASTAEAWVPRETLAADAVTKPILDGFDAREAAFKAKPVTAEAQPAAAQNPPVAATPLDPAAGIQPNAPGVVGTPPAGARPARRARGGGGDPVQDQHQPTVLYNGMIAPVIPYAIRGVIWYQGESILGNPGIPAYAHVMETLVTSWRGLWHEGNFPFYAVQLAALKNNSNNPRVREAQAEILSVPDTGLAVTVDIGDPANVHPKNKEPLGDRLSRIALANVYGKKMEYSGPVYASMKVEGDAVRLSFTHAQGLTTHYPDALYAHVSGPSATGVTPSVPLPPEDGPLKWFQVAGADGKYVDADAKIEGSTVVVKSADVPAPVSVRYAWDSYPLGANLYNAAGLPAVPFRTNKMDDAAAATTKAQ